MYSGEKNFFPYNIEELTFNVGWRLGIGFHFMTVLSPPNQPHIYRITEQQQYRKFGGLFGGVRALL